MTGYILILTSITYVNKAQYILTQNNIKSYVVKLRATTERHGCGYGLEINESYLHNAVSIIENNKIKIVEIIKNNE